VRSVRDRWGRASGRIRVASALLATAVATAVVVTLGTAGAPGYAGTAPLVGQPVDELRHGPVAGSWRLDPVADLGLDARETCVDYAVVGTVDDDVVLSVALTGRQVLGSPSCPNEPPRLVRLDPATGDVAWVLDPARTLGVDQGSGAEGIVSVWFDDADQVLAGVAPVGPTTRSTGRTAVVEVSGASAAAHARLDLATGAVDDVQRSDGGARSRVVSAAGRYVLVADEQRTGDPATRQPSEQQQADEQPSDDGASPQGADGYVDGSTAGDDLTALTPGPSGSAADDDAAADAAEADDDVLAPRGVPRTRWSLVRRDDLGDPLWTGSTEDDATPLLLDDRLVLPGEEAALVVEGDSGHVSTWGGTLTPASLPFTVDGELFVAGPSDGASGLSGGRLAALTRDGDERWSRDYAGDRFPVLAGSCVLFTSRGEGVTCVDARTGEQRWERDDEGAAFLTARAAPPGSTTGDAWLEVARQPGDDAEGTGGRGPWTRSVVAVDVATGGERFRADVPREARLRAASRTVGYAFSARSQTGRETAVTAFDLADGRPLWDLTRDDGDLQFWGGSLVRLDVDGTARRLVDPVRVAP